MDFVKYQHVEKFGTTETEDIELGLCFIFPKIDGTNASVWLDSGEVCAGSRNRKLSLEEDNAGFLSEIQSDARIREYLEKNPTHRIFGEWLVPHSLKTYRDDAWRKFWIFDVMDGEKYIHYDTYKPDMDVFGLDYITPVALAKNPTIEVLLGCLDRNTFLIKDGQGIGEGVVIKRYDYVNRYGRTVWAKIVTTEFKEKNARAFGVPIVKGEAIIEEAIVEEFCTEALIEKEYAKIINEAGGWSSKLIPRLLNTVFYCLVQEETWNIIKKHGNPRIDFNRLSQYAIMKIKRIKSELF